MNLTRARSTGTAEPAAAIRRHLPAAALVAVLLGPTLPLPSAFAAEVPAAQDLVASSIAHHDPGERLLSGR